ncbi:MAG TPA: hypothetical protein VH142_03155 [Polyangiaceae bacterium]|jgi:hypothetical protein|nr:hypothetical protein [Polyangiaceae bacterium]
MTARSWRSLLWSVVFAVVAACANTGGVGGDSETNWLTACSSDGQCKLGSCLCGVCTTSCDPNGSCAGGPPGSSCTETFCGGNSTTTRACFKRSGSAAAPLTGPEGGACTAHEFLYDDVSCNAPGPGPVDAAVFDNSCSPAGDGLCHARCATNADCTDPARPYCGILGLWADYDYNCNVGVLICRERPGDDCPRSSGLDLQ